MKKFSWLLTGPVALVGFALPCAGQTPPSSPHVLVQGAENVVQPVANFTRPWHPRVCPPSLGPIEPTKPAVPSTLPSPAPTPSPTPTAPADPLPTEGRYKSSFGLGTAVSAGFGISASVASGAAGFPIPAANMRVATISSTPLIMPGLFTAASAQSVIPVDRVSFDYGHFNRFAIATGSGTAPGFNLNQFGITVEKTVLDGIGSVYVNVPFLVATENITGQAIDGLGDVSAGFKMVLWKDRETGTTFSGGFTVAAPTARDTTITNTLLINFTGGPTPPGVVPPPVGTIIRVTSTTTVNPTYLQPWIGGVVSLDKWFIQEYFGILIPTDDRVATIINNNFIIGYNLYSDPDRFVRSITPTFGVQMLLPVNHVSSSTGDTTAPVNINCLTTVFPEDQLPTRLGFSHQVFLTAGVQMGLGERCLFSAGVTTPVVGPRGYAVGGTVGLSYFY